MRFVFKNDDIGLSDLINYVQFRHLCLYKEEYKIKLFQKSYKNCLLLMNPSKSMLNHENFMMLPLNINVAIK